MPKEIFRTCIVTREKKPKTELIKITAERKENDFFISVENKKALKGRGVYLLPDLEFFEKSLKGKLVYGLKINRKLRMDEVERLREEFKEKLKIKS